MLDTRQLSGLLYSMGHTFDNLSSTYIATDEFLRTDNPLVIGSRSDLALLEDLRDAAQFTLHTDLTVPLGVAFVEGINGQLSRSAALEPGVLRNAENMMVRTKQGNYIPPVPDKGALLSCFQDAAEITDPLKAGSFLFSHLARMQPFGDGNKRTALLAANRLLMLRDETRALVVPVDDPDKTTFNDLLGKWYINGEDAVIDWLADFNRAYSGLDDSGHPIKS